MSKAVRFQAVCLACLVLVACARPLRRSSHDAFFSSLRALCGKSFAGRLAVDVLSPPPSPFAGKQLVMHVRDCERNVVRIPLHVGTDRSRTLVVTRTATGIRLKHFHRHVDGSEDARSQYGGDASDAGTAQRQEYRIDDFSVALFNRLQTPASVTNTWFLEVVQERALFYGVFRPGGGLLRMEFDLASPVPTPPVAWGM